MRVGSDGTTTTSIAPSAPPKPQPRGHLPRAEGRRRERGQGQRGQRGQRGPTHPDTERLNATNDRDGNAPSPSLDAPSSPALSKRAEPSMPARRTCPAAHSPANASRR